MDAQTESGGIGSLNEKPLHAALKEWCAEPGARFEVPLDGFVIDIVQGDVLVEIQSRSFASIKRKLHRLTREHKVRLVYPVAREKWIVKLSDDGDEEVSRRKSPKRGGIELVFEELVSFPQLIAHPNFSLAVLLIQEEEVRHYDPKRNWRRKGWATHERRLLDVVDQQVFDSPESFSGLLPPELPPRFTTADLAAALSRPRRVAQQMAYCLREMGAIEKVGTQSRSILYERTGVGELKASPEKTPGPRDS